MAVVCRLAGAEDGDGYCTYLRYPGSRSASPEPQLTRPPNPPACLLNTGGEKAACVPRNL